ncbi:MAG TPA: alpha/beta fold hydrolase, partial [Streptosporangiaceae bacterium]|nr:alpha/beta fold hydrolase [Streptosporangiaceae bacterium]
RSTAQLCPRDQGTDSAGPGPHDPASGWGAGLGVARSPLDECPVDAGRSALTGYGRVGTPKDFRYSVDSYAGYLAMLLDQLGITRAHIVAHDFGGPWALAWAARHP